MHFKKNVTGEVGTRFCFLVFHVENIHFKKWSPPQSALQILSSNTYSRWYLQKKGAFIAHGRFAYVERASKQCSLLAVQFLEQGNLLATSTSLGHQCL